MVAMASLFLRVNSSVAHVTSEAMISETLAQVMPPQENLWVVIPQPISLLR